MNLATLDDDALVALISDEAGKVDRRLAGRTFAVTDEISDLGIDSMTTMELIVRIEDAVGARFPDDVLAKISTVGDLVTLIRQSQG